jgi:hypothetical protein
MLLFEPVGEARPSEALAFLAAELCTDSESVSIGRESVGEAEDS